MFFVIVDTREPTYKVFYKWKERSDNPFSLSDGIARGSLSEVQFDNINITDDDIATIFDFDFCGNGWLCMDIAYYILQLHNIERYDEKGYQPKVDSFLRGYESITIISNKKNINSLPALE